MSPQPIAAITDEFSPTDLDAALAGMADVGMTGAELRVVFDRNMIDLSDDEVDRARAAVEARGMTVVSLASPLLKCVLPDAPPLDSRVQHDVFGSPHTFEDQPRLTRRAFEVAERVGAAVVRVFSYWRTVEPAKTFERVAAALYELAEEAAKRGMVIGLENEHACNVGTGEEAGRLLAAIEHPALKLLWDPANAFILGETPYPDGYSNVPADRIVHIHAKDCRVRDHKPTWGPMGEMDVDWRGQIRALNSDGYTGWISLETHWTGPKGDKFEASTICGRNLRDLIRSGGA
ncbi:MAG: sugar phosphate isomerase/epimerase family protein [Vicinamibacterales bacterium]